MINGRDIVVVGIQPWDIEIGSNCKNIAIELGKNNRVLYVNNPIDRVNLFKGRNSPKTAKQRAVLKGKASPITQISESFWVLNPKTIIEPVNSVGFKPIFDFFNRVNSKRFAKQIDLAINQLNFKNYIVFNDSSMFLGNHLGEYLKYDKLIYYIRDNLIFSPFPFWHTHGKRMEAQMIKKSDLVVTNSLYYLDYAKTHNENSFMVGQGCDVSLFDDHMGQITIAKELTQIPKPIIGYVGNIAKIRLDMELIDFIAKQRPQWQIVLVGPEDEAFKNSKLHQQANIHFLGSKPADTLPQYIKGFDVCINPQILNITTVGNYPRKIDEYLAMGKPVVATKTKAMEYFASHTYLADSKLDYLELIQKALNEDTPGIAEIRRAYARTHSWENNVKAISEALESIKNQ